MNILITGATGLIGQEIVAACHANNIGVNYLTTSKSKIVHEKNYKGFYWNPSVSEIDVNCFENVSAIINLAGASISKRWTSSYKKKIISSRVSSLETLYKGLTKVDSSAIESFVSASAIGIYPSSLSKFYSEDEEVKSDDFLSEVVSVWEAAADKFQSFNFSVSKIRVGLVLSNKGGALPEMARPIKYFVGSPFGSGKQWQSWIHIKDLAGIFLFAIENELNGAYNAVASNPVTNKKLVDKIAESLGSNILLPKVPAFVLKAILGQMSSILLSSQRVSNKKIIGEGFTFAFDNVGSALESFYSKKD
ncbi:TIGR01777 family protein [Cellulophaga sp. HaHaR_3_176]|uniref:TIGR01777 family oxidoreductase n=1 Tax=Cellulophaga sp. HaHaR_3_176 TaxID=1942464 RepID=UPI001C1FF4F6|nr:TIGR01777 family oxidoreductase [Cellulophaga sp. HaHaR_3_176]QWX82762.1 TIGR01777 family protein [Cellulophaga sp. HaHaR_3_176]